MLADGVNCKPVDENVLHTQQKLASSVPCLLIVVRVSTGPCATFRGGRLPTGESTNECR